MIRNRCQGLAWEITQKQPRRRRISHQDKAQKDWLRRSLHVSREGKYRDVAAIALPESISASTNLRTLRGLLLSPCCQPKKQKSRPKEPRLRAAKWEPMILRSSGFHFGFIDVKVCEDLLNILVLLQGLHQADHLLRCFPFQFHCRHWNHRQFG